MKVKISLTSGKHGIIELDGHNVADAVVAFTMNATAKTIPELVLDLQIIEWPLEVEGEFAVRVPDGTAEILEQLGWARPPTGAPDA